MEVMKCSAAQLKPTLREKFHPAILGAWDTLFDGLCTAVLRHFHLFDGPSKIYGPIHRPSFSRSGSGSVGLVGERERAGGVKSGWGWVETELV